MTGPEQLAAELAGRILSRLTVSKAYGCALPTIEDIEDIARLMLPAAMFLVESRKHVEVVRERVEAADRQIKAHGARIDQLHRADADRQAADAARMRALLEHVHLVQSSPEMS